MHGDHGEGDDIADDDDDHEDDDDDDSPMMAGFGRLLSYGLQV